MHNKPVIFISAVSGEFRSARDVVAKALTALGYEPKWQDIAPAEHGSLRGVLRKWIDHSVGVLQILGQRYGAEPVAPDPGFGRCSYTQYEARYARQRKKKVWYLFAHDTFPRDPAEPEPAELAGLQTRYLTEVKATGDIRHRFKTPLELENTVLRLRDDLARLRRRGRQLAAAVIALLVLIAAVATAHHFNQREDSGKLDLLAEQGKKLERGQEELRQMFETVIKGGDEKKLAQEYEAAVRLVASQHGIRVEKFSAYLKSNATGALGNATLGLQEKIRALREAGRFTDARDLALKTAQRLEADRQKGSREEIEAWVEASKSEIELGHYPKAYEYALKADTLADREVDFPTWSAARHQFGRALSFMRRDIEAEKLFRELVTLRTARLGAEHPDTLASRNQLAAVLAFRDKEAEAEKEHQAVLAIRKRTLGSEHPDALETQGHLADALYHQGNYAGAEQEYRRVLAISERTRGPEDRETLTIRDNLANALQTQGKFTEAEAEHRAVLAIRERVCGPEHPDTLTSRGHVANVLQARGKLTEAEAEHRAVLAIRERVLGPEHPDALASRGNLANVLRAQGKDDKAKQEYRAVLAIRERVLGPEHRETLTTRSNLATVLYGQRKYPEAERELRSVLAHMQKLLGPEHPDSLVSQNNLANALDGQGKHAEAEVEYRAVIAIGERVLGREHPHALRYNYNFALALEGQGKYTQALPFAKRAEEGRLKTLGPEHPDSRKAKKARERIETGLRRAKGSK